MISKGQLTVSYLMMSLLPANLTAHSKQTPSKIQPTATISAMPDVTMLVTAFGLGLLGGAHCIGMCGGIMAALSTTTTSSDNRQRWFLLLSYNVGRISSYTVAGMIIGSLGWALQQQDSSILTGMRIVAGLLLIAMGLYLANWWRGLTLIERLGGWIWKPLQPIASSLLPVKSQGQAGLLGLLWGWLPCGLVYSTLIWASTSGTVLQSALIMLCFGLGTLPVMLSSGLLANSASRFIRNRTTRSIAGILVIFYGIWTIPGPHQHWLTLWLQST